MCAGGHASEYDAASFTVQCSNEDFITFASGSGQECTIQPGCSYQVYSDNVARSPVDQAGSLSTVRHGSAVNALAQMGDEQKNHEVAAYLHVGELEEAGLKVAARLASKKRSSAAGELSSAEQTNSSTPDAKVPKPEPNTMTPKAMAPHVASSFKEGSEQAVAASRAGAPHAVAYLNGSKRIANVAGSNDGHRWDSASNRKCVTKGCGVILSLHRSAEWELLDHMIAYTCVGEWKCANPSCKLADQPQEEGKFNMKAAKGEMCRWVCNASGGKGCGRPMQRVGSTACIATRYRCCVTKTQQAPNSFQHTESSVVYVYSGRHASSCIRPKLPALSPVAAASVPTGVTPALAYTTGCQQLALAAAFCTDPTSQMESKAAMKELHTNPGLAKQLAKKLNRNSYEKQLDRMGVDELSAILFTKLDTTIIAYHNSYDTTPGWKGTVLIEGICRTQAHIDKLSMHEDWEFNQVHTLLAMCDNPEVLELLNSGLVQRMQDLYYHFDCEHPDVVKKKYSMNSCTYDHKSQSMIKLCCCIGVSESAIELCSAREATDAALRKHLSLLCPKKDWSKFRFSPRRGVCADEGYAGQYAYAPGPGDAFSVTGCQMHFTMDKEKRENALGKDIGAQFGMHAKALFVEAAIPAEFALAYVAFLAWMQTCEMQPETRKSIGEFLGFWMYPDRCRRVACAYQCAFGPLAQICEIMHAQTQGLGRKGLTLVQAIWFDAQYCMCQTADRFKNMLKTLNSTDRHVGDGPDALAAKDASRARVRQQQANIHYPPAAHATVQAPSHRSDKTTMQAARPQRDIYCSRPNQLKKHEHCMQGILHSLPNINKCSTDYMIQLPDGAHLRVGSEEVSKADITHWEHQQLSGTGVAAEVFERREEAPKSSEMRNRRFRTMSSGGTKEVRSRNGSCHARNVEKKATCRSGMEIIEVMWLTQQKVQLVLLIEKTNGKLGKETVTLGYEPMCSCRAMSTAGAADRCTAVTVCSHLHGCLVELFAETDVVFLRQVAWVTQELHKVLQKAETLKPSIGAAAKLHAQNEVDRLEGQPQHAPAGVTVWFAGIQAVAQLQSAHKDSGNPYAGAQTCRTQFRRLKRKAKQMEQTEAQMEQTEAFIGAKVLVEYDSPGGKSHKDHEGCVSQALPVAQQNLVKTGWCKVCFSIRRQAVDHQVLRQRGRHN